MREYIEEQDWYLKGIKNVEKLITSGKKIALMCAEEEPANCHRGYIVSNTLLDDKFIVKHIRQDGKTQIRGSIATPLDQREIVFLNQKRHYILTREVSMKHTFNDCFRKAIALTLFSAVFFLNASDIRDKGELMERKTEYFTFIYPDKNSGYLDEMISHLEDNYGRIVSALDMEGKISHITVRVYPSIEEFHQATNMTGAPKTALGTVWGHNEIRIASPLSEGLPVSYEDMVYKLPVHEFAHCVVYHICNPMKIPYWLWEGVALYMAGQQTDLSKLSYIKEGNYPPYEQLNSVQYAFQLGCSLIEFIIESYGMNGLKELLLAEGDTEKGLKVNSVLFYESWKNFVEEKLALNSR